MPHSSDWEKWGVPKAPIGRFQVGQRVKFRKDLGNWSREMVEVMGDQVFTVKETCERYLNDEYGAITCEPRWSGRWRNMDWLWECRFEPAECDSPERRAR